MKYVENFMTKNPVFASVSDSLATARNLMLKHKISRLLVENSGELVGILTQKDIMVKILEMHEKPIDNIPIVDAMTGKVFTIKQDKTVKKAAELMVSKDVSGLPVVDDSDAVVGVLTKTDVVKYYVVEKPTHKVMDYCTKNILTISPYNTVFQAMKLMENGDVNRLLVVDGGEVVGVVSESDLTFVRFHSRARKIMRGEKHMREIPLIVHDVMNTDLITIQPDGALWEAGDKMLKHGIGALPVISNKLPKGIVSKTDIMRALID